MSQSERDSHGGGRMVGRFEMFGPIASGGFAAVHLGRTSEAGGSSKMVAIKRLHRQFAEDPEITKMFLDEARVVARIKHPNVVPVLDFIEQDGELFMVMEYVEGVTLGHLRLAVEQKDERIPLDIALSIIVGTLHGLHAAHEARDERGNPLSVIHRDVSPDNILVGVDGHARILDFGVARALGRYQSTHGGQVKSKPSYMTPEQVMGEQLTRRADVFSASVVLWECLTGRRLFEGEHLGELAMKVTKQMIAPPSTFTRTLPRKYDDIVMKGLERDPSMRWETTERMADAIETVGKLASHGRVGKWVKTMAADKLTRRSDEVSAIELTPVGGLDVPITEELAAAHSSEGEDSFKAAATQVLRMKVRTRPTTEEGTEIIETEVHVAEEPTPVSRPAKELRVPIAPPSHPEFVPVLGKSTSAKPAARSKPVAAEAPPKPPPPPAPVSEPVSVEEEKGVENDDAHARLAAVSSVHPVAMATGSRRKLAMGVGLALGGVALAVLAAIVWRGPSPAASGEPETPRTTEQPAPPKPAAPPAPLNGSDPKGSESEAKAEPDPLPPPAPEPTAEVEAPPSKPPPIARVAPRPVVPKVAVRPRPAPPPPPRAVPKPDNLFERE